MVVTGNARKSVFVQCPLKKWLQVFLQYLIQDCRFFEKVRKPAHHNWYNLPRVSKNQGHVMQRAEVDTQSETWLSPI
jgi:hypothetical protein